MAMKQTQTKFFDFSDSGLDFSAASINLIEDRFKKMFALGFNEQTVTSVSTAGNQVTFTYGGVHGYKADRVLKITSGALLDINNGEFRIDSVTTNTVTMTIDGAPTLIAGSFTTKVAPLGWDLVYELDHVQIYKFKALNESELYLRLYLAPPSANCVALHPCIGKSFDQATGFITDPYAFAENKNILGFTSGVGSLSWVLFGSNNPVYANYTYSQGISANIGRGVVVGSPYHLGILCSAQATPAQGYGQISAIVPACMQNYPELDYPVLFGRNQTNSTVNTSTFRMYCGNVDLTLSHHENSTADRYMTVARDSFISTKLDGFNSTSATPFYFKEAGTYQVLGISAGGAYQCSYGTSNTPPRTSADTPWESADIDFENKIIVHYVGNTVAQFIAFPIEEVKYGY